jgi:toxin ParE1/3/4
MGIKVRLHARALADLLEIKRYLTEHASPEVAERVRIHLRSRIAQLGDTRLGIATSHPAVRVLSPGKYPYRIYFTFTDEVVVILHIRHSSRRSVDVETLL